MKRNKFKLSNYTRELDGKTLHRIEALKDFNDVKRGDIGGWVESEENLSQKGDCWIYNNAMVYNNALVYGNAKVYDNVEVYDNSNIYDNAVISMYAKVHGNAIAAENVTVSGRADIYGNTFVLGNSIIRQKAIIKDNAKILDNAYVSGNSTIRDNAKILNNASIIKDAIICGNTTIDSYSTISNKAVLSGNNYLCLEIDEENENPSYITFYRNDIDNDIYVTSNTYIEFGTTHEFKYRLLSPSYNVGINTFVKYLKAIELAESKLKIKKR